MKTGLSDKAVLITGAGSGMGRASALLFASEGANVMAADIDEASAAETAATARANGGRAESIRADVANRSDSQRMVAETISRFGRLDVLVNNAGAERMVPLLVTDDETWNLMMDVNARSVYLSVQQAVPEMLKSGGGAIVNVASAAAFRGSPGLTAYSAAKAAVVAMTKCLAAELAGSGIRVNSVAPGLIDTPMGRRAMDAVGGRDAMMKLVSGALSIKRPGLPEEIARAVVFLASDLSSYVTGVTLPVDGGMTAL
jgi:NAD(P)-dependent dehydrogenase (short-subunit alcohol dehydrogenase family)